MISGVKQQKELIKMVEWTFDDSNEIWIPWSDIKKIYQITKRELYQAVSDGKVRMEIKENWNHPDNKEFTVYAVEDLVEFFPIKEKKPRKKNFS